MSLPISAGSNPWAVLGHGTGCTLRWTYKAAECGGQGQGGSAKDMQHASRSSEPSNFPASSASPPSLSWSSFAVLAWDGRTHACLSDLDKHCRPGCITSVLGGVARPKRPPDSAGCEPLRRRAPVRALHPEIAHRQPSR